jgi:hypothetical protein
MDLQSQAPGHVCPEGKEKEAMKSGNFALPPSEKWSLGSFSNKAVRQVTLLFLLVTTEAATEV